MQESLWPAAALTSGTREGPGMSAEAMSLSKRFPTPGLFALTVALCRPEGRGANVTFLAEGASLWSLLPMTP